MPAFRLRLVAGFLAFLLRAVAAIVIVRGMWSEPRDVGLDKRWTFTGASMTSDSPSANINVDGGDDIVFNNLYIHNWDKPIATDQKFDATIRPLVPTFVEFDAHFDATCVVGFCAGRAPVLTIVSLRAVVSPEPPEIEK